MRSRCVTENAEPVGLLSRPRLVGGTQPVTWWVSFGGMQESARAAAAR